MLGGRAEIRGQTVLCLIVETQARSDKPFVRELRCSQTKAANDSSLPKTSF
jgi:hypothetical protein